MVLPLIFEKLRNKTKVSDLFNFDLKTEPPVTANLKERLKSDLFKNSLPALLRYEDHTSMAFSIESRVPFLDYRLVEFVFSLPDRYLIRNGWNKWIMRQALCDLLPAKIVSRRWKVGFSTPEVSWLRETADEVRKLFQSATFLSRPYFNHAKIQQGFDEFAAGKTDDSMVFWRIINVELWLRIYFPQIREKI